MSESLEEKLARMQEEKAAIKAKSDNKLVGEFTGNAEETKDFSEIAKEFKARKEQEAQSVNFEYRKDTIYIRSDIYSAFNALCVRQGQKKQFVNEALSDFIMKKYKEMEEGK